MSIELTRPTQTAPGEVLTSGLVGQAGALNGMGAGATVLFHSGAIRTSETYGVNLQGGLASQQVLIGATGSIVMSGGANLIGVAASGANGPQIKNYGAISVTTSGTGAGISLVSPAVGSQNAGSISLTGSGNGVLIAGAGASEFQNSGTIQAIGSSVNGVRFSVETASFTNWASGSIQAFGATASVGLYVSADFTQAGAGIRNYGVIEGATSIQIAGYTSAAPSLEILNGAGGVLRGRVVGSAGAERMTNAGLIEGDVQLGAGDDSYQGSGSGFATGMVAGGDGADTLIGGDVFDYLHGNQGDDSVAGAGGDDWIVGGQGNDVLHGDAGADVCLGNLGADTIDGGAGDDVVRGGQGDDSVSGGSGNDFVSGDRGDDIMVGGLGADRFHSFAEAGTDRVLDFSRAQGDTVNLLAGSTYTVAQVGADVVITVGGTAQLILVGVSMSTLTGDWLTVG